MKIRTVADLIEVLAKCDPKMLVATHANNHEYIVGKDERTLGRLRVGLLRSSEGPHVIIGNISRRALNPPNWYVEHELDGGGEIPHDWF